MQTPNMSPYEPNGRSSLYHSRRHHLNSISDETVLCTWWKTGWRFGIIRGALAAFLIFCLNLGVFIWTREKLEPTENGTGQFYEGNCSTALRLNTVIHLLINVLSTILLSCSNYTMQCLSAPTLAEIDYAHSRNSWLHIVVHSPGNFKHIHRSRTLLWCILAVSSLPLRLFYNSVVFTSQSAIGYTAMEIPHSLLVPGSLTLNWTNITTNNIEFYKYSYEDAATNSTCGGYPLSDFPRLMDDALAGNLENLTNADCINAYGQDYLTNCGNMLLIVDDSSENIPNNALQGVFSYVGDLGQQCDPYGWISDSGGGCASLLRGPKCLQLGTLRRQNRILLKPTSTRTMPSPVESYATTGCGCNELGESFRNVNCHIWFTVISTKVNRRCHWVVARTTKLNIIN